ncbi:hypothetical protein JTE90_002430 [Oedothorax gibbosus]|uniref:C2H2-type domain-containing protein n=1 Tax=Oedothorax gibbosus TaxID=931172 RepID=A0AAV6UWP9_9ARAC|nr:hypothetical protein JTE90_002430 [Oedothorax gibbosus]
MRRKGTSFSCTYEGCTASFSRPDRLRNHLRTHTGERPFICRYPECAKSFGSSQHLRRHEITHESSFNCTIEGCSEVFKRKDALKKHLDNIHYKKQPKLYKCTECDKQFNKHSWLQSHMYKHTGTFPYICQTEGCGKGFLLPSKLKRHMKIHEGHVCKIPGCEATFLKWSLYMAHLKGFHPKVHMCNICDRKFTHPPNLKAHLEMHKESRKVFACEVSDCPRFYFAEKNLKWHVKTYHEARPYACDKEHCHRAFKTKDALDQHTLRHTRRTPRKKKKPKPSFSAVLSGCEDARKFIYRTPRKKILTESSEELTTDGEIEYQDTSSDENNNKSSASEMTDASEKIIDDRYRALQSIDSQFDETESDPAGLNKGKKSDLALSEYGSANEIAGPSTKQSEIESKHNYKTQNTLKPLNKRRKLEIVKESSFNSTMSPISECEIISMQDNIDCYTDAHQLNQIQTNIDVLHEKSTLDPSRYDHIESKHDCVESEEVRTESVETVENHTESENEDIKSFQDVCNSVNEENANSSEYETIKVSVFGNVCVWEKSYSGSEEVSSCLSEAEDLLNCDDVFTKRER